MPYKILYHPDIFKYDLPVIPPKIKQSISEIINLRLSSNPISFGQPLRQSLKGHRRLRVGGHVIIYRIEGGEIIVLNIGAQRVTTKHFR